MRLVGFISAITLSVLLLAAQYFTGSGSVPTLTLGEVQGFATEKARDLPVIVRSLNRIKHKGLPKASLEMENSMYLVRLVFPSEMIAINELTDDIRLGIKAVLVQLRQ